MFIISDNDNDIFVSVFDLLRPVGQDFYAFFIDALINPEGEQVLDTSFCPKDQDGNYQLRWRARYRVGDGAIYQQDFSWPSGSVDNYTISLAGLTPLVPGQ
jgi:hypothetical protein